MRTTYCVSVVGAALLANARAAVTIAEWNGLAGTTQMGVSANGNVGALDLSRGSGIIETTGSSFNSRAWHEGGDFSAAVAAGDYLTFGITVASGYKLTNLTIRAGLDRSATGPATYGWGYDVSGGTNFVQLGVDEATPDPGAVVTSSSLVSPLTGTVTFGIVGWDATGSAGTMDIEGSLLAAGDVGLRISADVLAVPEPSSAILLGMGGLSLLSRRKRTHRIRNVS